MSMNLCSRPRSLNDILKSIGGVSHMKTPAQMHAVAPDVYGVVDDLADPPQQTFCQFGYGGTSVPKYIWIDHTDNSEYEEYPSIFLGPRPPGL